MQTSFLLSLLVAGLGSAQFEDIPSCGLNCIIDGIQNDGCPNIDDFRCHCSKPELVQSIQPCVEAACNVSEQSAVSSAVVSLCSSAGVPITVPPVTVTSSATTTPTGGASTVPGASPSGSESTGSGGWTSPTASVSDRSPPADSISTITSAPGASTTPAASSSAPVSGSSSPVSDPSPALLASPGAAVDLKFDLGLVAAMVGVAAFAL